MRNFSLIKNCVLWKLGIPFGIITGGSWLRPRDRLGRRNGKVVPNIFPLTALWCFDPQDSFLGLRRLGISATAAFWASTPETERFGNTRVRRVYGASVPRIDTHTHAQKDCV